MERGYDDVGYWYRALFDMKDNDTFYNPETGDYFFERDKDYPIIVDIIKLTTGFYYRTLDVI